MTSHLRAQADECHTTAHALRKAAARQSVAAAARPLRDIARTYERIGTQLRNIATTLSLFSAPDPDPVPHARDLLTHKHHLDQQLANREATP
ncbi:hypothetical protein CQR46_0941 [Bifidobacterium pseudolongum subsp. globosum]|uniref:Uncharacterized protein n=1 Tax=Bifidobacterium pseudolongum subsp. globosum TaxID=1690 RepID=A0A2N3QHH6_9BIFI|nr:hypothetical protein [Bifidobacterium pseudolongum]PKU90745.1 hypothetical protein CQR46_0941 [Bifidobacterium pseudolongum subsp. globosum]